MTERVKKKRQKELQKMKIEEFKNEETNKKKEGDG